MTIERLKWICAAIEYDNLTRTESAFLFTFVEDFNKGKPGMKIAEEKLEELFAEVQWRKNKWETLYSIWSKKEENKELVPIRGTVLIEGVHTN